MQDLMNSVSAYLPLSMKYGGFMVPAFQIRVDNTDVVKRMKATVTDISVNLSLNAAGSAEFSIADAYDEEKHSFPAALKRQLKPGAIVEIELGYQSSTSLIFKGYLDTLTMEFGDNPLIHVTAMDARKLMMGPGRRLVLHDVKNYSDAFRTVIGAYSRLCTPKIDATSDKLKSPLAQTSSDYLFVTKELIRTGRAPREFFIFADKAYFRKPGGSRVPAMTVQYGRELTALTVSAGYLDASVEVYGCDPDVLESVVGTAAAKSNGPQKSLMSRPPVWQFEDPEADTSAKVQARAKDIARRELERTQRAHGSLIGLPEIVPGRFLKVAGLDSFADRKFYIQEVHHVMDQETFTTSFDSEGWE